MRLCKYGLRRSGRGQEEQGEMVGLGRRWGELWSRSLESNVLGNCSEGEGFYGCNRRMGGTSILKHLGLEGFLL